MSLNFGEIHGSLTLDTAKWTKGLQTAFKSGDKMVADAKTSYTKGGTKAGTGFATGVTKALVPVAKKLSAPATAAPTAYGKAGTQSGTGFASGVDRGTRNLGTQIAKTVAPVAAKFASEGTKSGNAFADGAGRGTKGLSAALSAPLEGVRADFTKAGTKAGDGFSDGVKKGTGRKMLGGVDQELNAQPAKFGHTGEESGHKLSEGASRGAAGMGGKLTKILDGAKEELLMPAAAIGAAIGALLTESIMLHFEIEKAVAHMNTVLGAEGPRAAMLGKIAGNLYFANFGDSIDQVTEAIQVAFQNGLIPGGVAAATNADITRITGNLMNLSTVMKQDLGMTAEAVGNMVRNGLVKTVDEGMNVMTAAIQKGADKAGDLAATFQEYSTQFRQAGITAAEAAGLMVQGLQHGARDADVVADSIKEMLLQSQGAMSTTTVTADTHVAAMQKVVSAQRNVVSAEQNVVSAERNLQQQQRNSMTAQKALTDARAAAAQQLKDLAGQTEDAAMGQESADIALARAKETLANLPKDATALDQREAKLAVDEATKALADQKQQVADLAAQKATADAKGIEGSDGVLNALGGVMQAAQDQQDAQRGVAEAQQGVSDANRDMVASRKELAGSYGGETKTLTGLGLAYKAVGVDGADAQRKIAKGGQGAHDVLMNVLDGLRNIEDPLVRNQAGLLIFGTKWEDMQQAILGLDLHTANDQIDGNKDHIIKLGDAYNNTSDTFEGNKRTIMKGVGEMASVVGRFFVRMGQDVWNWGNNVAGAFMGVIHFASKLPGLIGDALSGIWDGITAGVGNAYNWVIGIFEAMVTWVQSLPGRIAAAVVGMWDGIVASFKLALNWVIDHWNTFGFVFPTIHVPMIGDVGGWHFDTPDIPRFHTGTGEGGVPGTPGRERLAMVMPGETIRTVPQERALQGAMRDLASMAGSHLISAGTGASGVTSSAPRAATSAAPTQISVTVPVAFHGPVAGQDGVRWVKAAIAEGTAKGIITARDMAARQ